VSDGGGPALPRACSSQSLLTLAPSIVSGLGSRANLPSRMTLSRPNRRHIGLLIHIDGDAGLPVAALDRLNGSDPDGSVSREVLAWIIADLDERLEIARFLGLPEPVQELATISVERRQGTWTRVADRNERSKIIRTVCRRVGPDVGPRRASIRK
jgi:hypothetical protein